MYGALVAGVEQREVRNLVRRFIITLQEAATSQQHVGCRYGKLMEGLWFRNTSSTRDNGSTVEQAQASSPSHEQWSWGFDERSLSEAFAHDQVPTETNTQADQTSRCTSGEPKEILASEDSPVGPLQLSSDTYTMLFQGDFNPDIFNIGAVDFSNTFLDPLFSLE